MGLVDMGMGIRGKMAEMQVVVEERGYDTKTV